MKKLIIITLILFPTLLLIGQEDFNGLVERELFQSGLMEYDNEDKLHELPNQDISNLWLETKSSAIHGFIGNNFLRIKVKFLKVVPNYTEKNEYFVYGKTKVKNNTCDFRGIITIKKMYYGTMLEDPDKQCGAIVCEYRFLEDPTIKSTGVFAGQILTKWTIRNDSIVYDDLFLDRDGFSNNHYVGTWTGYNKKTSLKCNWGDYRIPLDGNFDSGAGMFSPDRKSYNQGWNYRIDASDFSKTEEERRKAWEKEIEEWW